MLAAVIIIRPLRLINFALSEMATKLGSITKLKGSENYQGWSIMAKVYLLREGLAKAILLEENNNDRI